MASNFDTVKAVTGNIEKVLDGLGVHFSTEVNEGTDGGAASIMPYGRIFYTGETFEYTHGQRPGYGEAGFRVKVFLRAGDGEAAVTEQQRWVHRIREALTVDALNTGDIGASKPVSRVVVSKAEAKGLKNVSTVVLDVLVRYREM